MPTGVVFFDVDGTLVHATSSSQYLAARLGHLEALADAEAAYARGEMDNRVVSIIDAAAWGGFTEGQVRHWLTELPLVAGVPEVVAWCRQRCLVPVLATLAWEPVGDFLCAKYGFEAACGPRLASAGGTFTGEVASHLDEFGKRDFAITFAAAAKVEPGRCAAVGDSRSDLPLFTEVGLSIAFNGDDAARGAANVSLESDDLSAVIPVLTGWLATL